MGLELEGCVVRSEIGDGDERVEVPEAAGGEWVVARNVQELRGEEVGSEMMRLV